MGYACTRRLIWLDWHDVAVANKTCNLRSYSDATGNWRFLSPKWNTFLEERHLRRWVTFSKDVYTLSTQAVPSSSFTCLSGVAVVSVINLPYFQLLIEEPCVPWSQGLHSRFIILQLWMEILCLPSWSLHMTIRFQKISISECSNTWLNFNANECGYMMVAKGDRIRGLSPLCTNENVESLD